MGAGMEGAKKREPQWWLQAGKGSCPTAAGPQAASLPPREQSYCTGAAKVAGALQAGGRKGLRFTLPGLGAAACLNRGG